MLRLEALESQGKLIDLIQDASSGIGAGRKALQQLGKTPCRANVGNVLQTVSRR